MKLLLYNFRVDNYETLLPHLSGNQNNSNKNVESAPQGRSLAYHCVYKLSSVVSFNVLEHRHTN